MRNIGLFLVAALACAALGCGWSPKDKAVIPLKSTPVQFMGMAPAAGVVSFYALNHATGQYEMFGSVNTNGNTYADSKGTIWHEYDTTMALPQDDRYWKLGCCTEWPPWYISIKTRMGSADFFAFDNDQSEACITANYGSLGGVDLGAKCATRWMGDKKTVTISVPIGAKGQHCGDPNWLKGSCFAGLFCGQDNICQDSDLYCPSGQIARWDGKCESKSSWPVASDIRALPDFPADDERNWTNDVQGIASSGAHWFISNTERICRFNARDLTRDCPKWDPNVRNDANAFPESIRGDIHLSNMDFYGGYLYVGAYRHGGDANQVVSVMNTDMGQATYAWLGHDEAFLAIHPKNGDLYTISNASPRTLGVYRRDHRPESRVLALTRKATVKLVNADGSAFSGNRYQGGKFSPSGKLYLVFDDDNPSRGGIFIFNVAPTIGRLIMRQPVAYEGGGYNCGIFFPAGDREQELEDILIESIGSGSYAGQLHQLLLNNDCDTDNYWLKHFSVAPGKL